MSLHFSFLLFLFLFLFHVSPFNLWRYYYWFPTWWHQQPHKHPKNYEIKFQIFENVKIWSYELRVKNYSTRKKGRKGWWHLVVLLFYYVLFGLSYVCNIHYIWRIEKTLIDVVVVEAGVTLTGTYIKENNIYTYMHILYYFLIDM